MNAGLRERTESRRKQVRSIVDEWFAETGTGPVMDCWLRGFEVGFSKKLSEAGLLGLTWPTQYGGQGASNVERLAVTEELLRLGAPSAAHWSSERQIGPAILRHGSEELKAEFLPSILSLDSIVCLGMSELNAGSDLAAVETRAERVDGGWAITGQKMWTGHAHRATHAYVLARTSVEDRKHDGLSEFLMDLGSEGVTVAPIINIGGEHRFNQMNFDQVFVPDSRVIGTVGNGWRQVVEQLSFERGGAERYLSSYALFTELLRRAQSSRRDVRRRVGALTRRLAAIRQIARDVAELMDSGEAPVVQAAALKMIGNQFELDVVEALRDLLEPGDLARTSDYAITLQSTPGFALRGGAVEVLLSIIAKAEAVK